MWEYKVDPYTQDHQDLRAFLDRYGEDGWQLVTLVPADFVHAQGETMKDQLSTAETLAIFKRQR